MMAQGERRAKAVLAAAIAWTEFLAEQKIDLAQMTDGPACDLVRAVDKYKEVLAAKLPADPSAPMAFTCPHCDAERPGYGWHLNGGDTGPFALTFVTCFCAECKNILAVNITSFMPSREIAEQLKQQFAAQLVKPS